MGKLRILTILLLLTLIAPMTGSAQSDPQVTSLEIAIWPEYDRPGALVIYMVRLAQDSPLPAVISLPIPSRVGKPHAVAAWTPEGILDENVTWTATPRGDWTMVEVTTATNGVWLEFYDDMVYEGDQRSYNFTWPGGFDIDSLNFELLPPLDASDFRVTPEGVASEDPDGLTYTRLDLGASRADQTFSIDLSYSRRLSFTGELPALRSNPTFERFEVALWPEYDQLSTLVIYRGTLPSELPLPVTVSLPIPVSAGEPFAVATVGSDERLYTAEYQRQVEVDWAWITFESESSAFQVEYYDDLLLDGDSRSFTFFWPGVIETGAFSYELQQPIGARALQVTPAGEAQSEANGLLYVRSGFGPQQPGSPLWIRFQYEKSSSELTANVVAAAPSIDRPLTTQGGTPDPTAQLPLIVAGVGILLVVIGIILYLRFQRQAKPSPRRPRQRKTRSKPKQEDSDLDAAAVFCHVCGAKASASDHFCRTCGTKLRQ